MKNVKNIALYILIVFISMIGFFACTTSPYKDMNASVILTDENGKELDKINGIYQLIYDGTGSPIVNVVGTVSGVSNKISSFLNINSNSKDIVNEGSAIINSGSTSTKKYVVKMGGVVHFLANSNEGNKFANATLNIIIPINDFKYAANEIAVVRGTTTDISGKDSKYISYSPTFTTQREMKELSISKVSEGDDISGINILDQKIDVPLNLSVSSFYLTSTSNYSVAKRDIDGNILKDDKGEVIYWNPSHTVLVRVFDPITNLSAIEKIDNNANTGSNKWVNSNNEITKNIVNNPDNINIKYYKVEKNTFNLSVNENNYKNANIQIISTNNENNSNIIDLIDNTYINSKNESIKSRAYSLKISNMANGGKLSDTDSLMVEKSDNCGFSIKGTDILYNYKLKITIGYNGFEEMIKGLDIYITINVSTFGKEVKLYTDSTKTNEYTKEPADVTVYSSYNANANLLGTPIFISLNGDNNTTLTKQNLCLVLTSDNKDKLNIYNGKDNSKMVNADYEIVNGAITSYYFIIPNNSYVYLRLESLVDNATLSICSDLNKNLVRNINVIKYVSDVNLIMALDVLTIKENGTLFLTTEHTGLGMDDISEVLNEVSIVNGDDIISVEYAINPEKMNNTIKVTAKPNKIGNAKIKIVTKNGFVGYLTLNVYKAIIIEDLSFNLLNYTINLSTTDTLDVGYQIDENGEYKLNDKGEKIKIIPGAYTVYNLDGSKNEIESKPIYPIIKNGNNMPIDKCLIQLLIDYDYLIYTKMGDISYGKILPSGVNVKIKTSNTFASLIHNSNLMTRTAGFETIIITVIGKDGSGNNVEIVFSFNLQTQEPIKNVRFNDYNAKVFSLGDLSQYAEAGYKSDREVYGEYNLNIIVKSKNSDTLTDSRVITKQELIIRDSTNTDKVLLVYDKADPFAESKSWLSYQIFKLEAEVIDKENGDDFFSYIEKINADATLKFYVYSSNQIRICIVKKDGYNYKVYATIVGNYSNQTFTITTKIRQEYIDYTGISMVQSLESPITINVIHAPIINSINPVVLNNLITFDTRKMASDANGLFISNNVVKFKYTYSVQNGLIPLNDKIIVASSVLQDISVSIDNKTKEITVTALQISDENYPVYKLNLYASGSKNSVDTYKISKTITIKIANGRANSPFEVASPSDLLLIQNALQSHYVLIKDIDMSTINWSPIEGIFTGSLNGYYTLPSGIVCKYNIYNFTMEKVVDARGSSSTPIQGEIKSKNYGLFDTIGVNAVIKNLTFISTKIHLTGSSGLDEYTINIGVIAGENNGTITNCRVNDGNDISSITSNTVNKVKSSKNGIFLDANDGKTSSKNIYNLGGIVGTNNANIGGYTEGESVKSSIAISYICNAETNLIFVGGICGTNGILNYKIANDAGDGFINKISIGQILFLDSFNQQNLSMQNIPVKLVVNAKKSDLGQGKGYIGGLSGINYGFISNARVRAFVHSNQSVGGLAGINAGKITNSIAIPTITGNKNVGGLVGVNINGVDKVNFGFLRHSSTNIYHNNNGHLYNNKVQFIDLLDTNSYFNTAIYGSENVGGLVGYFLGKYDTSFGFALESNSVYSYYDRNLSKKVFSINDKNNEYYGDIIATNKNVGGLIGYAEKIFINGAYVRANIILNSSSENPYISGLVAYIKDEFVINNVQIYGKFNTVNFNYFGPIIGYNNGKELDKTAIFNYQVEKVLNNSTNSKLGAQVDEFGDFVYNDDGVKYFGISIQNSFAIITKFDGALLVDLYNKFIATLNTNSAISYLNSFVIDGKSFTLEGSKNVANFDEYYNNLTNKSEGISVSTLKLNSFYKNNITDIDLLLETGLLPGVNLEDENIYYCSLINDSRPIQLMTLNGKRVKIYDTLINSVSLGRLNFIVDLPPIDILIKNIKLNTTDPKMLDIYVPENSQSITQVLISLYDLDFSNFYKDVLGNLDFDKNGFITNYEIALTNNLKNKILDLNTYSLSKLVEMKIIPPMLSNASAISISIADENIVELNKSDNSFIAKNSGKTTVTITSIFNTNLKVKFEIFVANKMNNFNIFVGNTKLTEISSFYEYNDTDIDKNHIYASNFTSSTNANCIDLVVNVDTTVSFKFDGIFDANEDILSYLSQKFNLKANAKYGVRYYYLNPYTLTDSGNPKDNSDLGYFQNQFCAMNFTINNEYCRPHKIAENKYLYYLDVDSTGGCVFRANVAASPIRLWVVPYVEINDTKILFDDYYFGANSENSPRGIGKNVVVRTFNGTHNLTTGISESNTGFTPKYSQNFSVTMETDVDISNDILYFDVTKKVDGLDKKSLVDSLINNNIISKVNIPNLDGTASVDKEFYKVTGLNGGYIINKGMILTYTKDTSKIGFITYNFNFSVNLNTLREKITEFTEDELYINYYFEFYTRLATNDLFSVDNTIKLNSQKVENILVNHFAGVELEVINKNNYSVSHMYPSNTLISTYPGILELNIIPDYGDVDYIEITSSTNGGNYIIFEQLLANNYKEGNEKYFSGNYRIYPDARTKITNGIRVSKISRYITNDGSCDFTGVIYLSTMCVLNNTEATKVNINIKTFKNGVKEPTFSMEKVIDVVNAPKVEISVDNEKNIPIAKGTEKQILVKTNCDNIVWTYSDISGGNTNCVKSFDEAKKTICASSSLGEFVLKATVSKVINGKVFIFSDSIHFMVVNFVVTDIAVDRVTNGRFIGVYNQPYTLNVKIIAEYDPHFEVEILKQITLLEQKISTQLDKTYYVVDNNRGEIFRESILINKQYSDFFIDRIELNGLHYFTIRNNVASPTSKLGAQVLFNYLYNNSGTSQTVDVEINPNTNQIGKYSAYKNTEFILSMTRLATIDNPEPIYTAKEFMNMKANEHYILLNDIVLSSEANFKSLDVAIGSLDGNSYVITIKDFVNNTSGTIGLFSTIYDLTIIKNLTIELLNDQLQTVEVQNGVLSSGQDIFVNVIENPLVKFGILAGVNNGTVTNAYITNNANSLRNERNKLLNLNQGLNLKTDYNVVSSNNRTNTIVRVSGTAAPNYNNRIGGLVGINNGYITNSNIENISIFGQNFVAGFVCENTNKISSSFISGGNIYSSTTAELNEALGASGFVLINNVGAKIVGCYVEGKTTPLLFEGSNLSTENYVSDIGASGKKENARMLERRVTSTSNASGFVYSNNGIIVDCYSNILVAGTNTSGFVFGNGEHGTITNCYSLSSVYNNQINAQPFTGRQGTGTAYNNLNIIENSYYLQSSVDHFHDLSNISTAGAVALSPNSFTPNILNSFSFSTNNDDNIFNGIWFMPSTPQVGILKDSYNSSVSDKITMDANKISTSVPQLVSANLKTMSIRCYSSTEKEHIIQKIYSYMLESIDGIKDFTRENIDVKIFIDSNLVKTIDLNIKYNYLGDKNLFKTTLEDTVLNMKINSLNISDTLEVLSASSLFSYYTILNNLDKKSIEYGSKLNPYLISSAEDFNSYILQKDENGNSTISDVDLITSNIRFIKDITLNKHDLIIETFNKDYAGIFDGNGMAINNLRVIADQSDAKTIFVKDGLITNDSTNIDYSYTALGIFRRINNATIKNLEINVSEVNGSGINIVGALAGEINNSMISNISINSANAISGLNAVGGICGRITGDSQMIGCKSTASIIANYYSSRNLFSATNYKSSKEIGDFNVYSNVQNRNIDKVSYAGAIAGIVDTYASITNIFENRFNTATGEIKILGEIVGGLYGFVGKNSKVSDSKFIVSEIKDSENYNSNAQLLGSRVTGGLVGQNIGQLNRVYVSYGEKIQNQIDKSIENATKTPNSNYIYELNTGTTTLFGNNAHFIGGLVGLNSGLIWYAYNKINVMNINSLVSGGLVGLNIVNGEKSTIKEAYTTGNVYSFHGVGGLIGLLIDNNYMLIDDLDSIIKNNCYIASPLLNNVENRDLIDQHIYSKTGVGVIPFSKTVSSNIWKKDSLSNRRSQIAIDAPQAFTGSLIGINKSSGYNTNLASRLVKETNYTILVYSFDTLNNMDNRVLSEIGNDERDIFVGLNNDALGNKNVLLKYIDRLNESTTGITDDYYDLKQELKYGSTTKFTFAISGNLYCNDSSLGDKVDSTKIYHFSRLRNNSSIRTLNEIITGNFIAGEANKLVSKYSDGKIEVINNIAIDGVLSNNKDSDIPAIYYSWTNNVWKGSELLNGIKKESNYIYPSLIPNDLGKSDTNINVDIHDITITIEVNCIGKAFNISEPSAPLNNQITAKNISQFIFSDNVVDINNNLFVFYIEGKIQNGIKVDYNKNGYIFNGVYQSNGTKLTKDTAYYFGNNQILTALFEYIPTYYNILIQNVDNNLDKNNNLKVEKTDKGKDLIINKSENNLYIGGEFYGLKDYEVNYIYNGVTYVKSQTINVNKDITIKLLYKKLPKLVPLNFVIQVDNQLSNNVDLNANYWQISNDSGVTWNKLIEGNNYTCFDTDSLTIDNINYIVTIVHDGKETKYKYVFDKVNYSVDKIKLIPANCIDVNNMLIIENIFNGVTNNISIIGNMKLLTNKKINVTFLDVDGVLLQSDSINSKDEYMLNISLSGDLSAGYTVNASGKFDTKSYKYSNQYSKFLYSTDKNRFNDINSSGLDIYVFGVENIFIKPYNNQKPPITSNKKSIKFIVEGHDVINWDIPSNKNPLIFDNDINLNIIKDGENCKVTLTDNVLGIVKTVSIFYNVTNFAYILIGENMQLDKNAIATGYSTTLTQSLNITACFKGQYTVSVNYINKSQTTTSYIGYNIDSSIIVNCTNNYVTLYEDIVNKNNIRKNIKCINNNFKLNIINSDTNAIISTEKTEQKLNNGNFTVNITEDIPNKYFVNIKIDENGVISNRNIFKGKIFPSVTFEKNCVLKIGNNDTNPVTTNIISIPLSKGYFISNVSWKGFATGNYSRQDWQTLVGAKTLLEENNIDHTLTIEIESRQPATVNIRRLVWTTNSNYNSLNYKNHVKVFNYDNLYDNTINSWGNYRTNSIEILKGTKILISTKEIKINELQNNYPQYYRFFNNTLGKMVTTSCNFVRFVTMEYMGIDGQIKSVVVDSLEIQHLNNDKADGIKHLSNISFGKTLDSNFLNETDYNNNCGTNKTLGTLLGTGKIERTIDESIIIYLHIGTLSSDFYGKQNNTFVQGHNYKF